MWTRADLKMRGKVAFQRNYWSAVIVGLVMSVVSTIVSVSNSRNLRGYNSRHGYYISEYSLLWAILGAFSAVLGLGIILLNIFVGNVLMVGGSRFFILNQTETANPAVLGCGFRSGHYGNIVLVMFLRDLFTFLWTLLLVVPGIIKYYEYLMVPYIIAENPAMSREEAFLISKKMMMGQKWEAFVLDLSFLGWRILEIATFGILGVFYVEPYIEATFSELYTFNRAMAYQNGYIR